MKLENEYRENLYIRGMMMDSSVEREEDYFAKLPMVRNLYKMRGLQFRKPVTFFVGENGTGKSTLLEAIAVCNGYNPEGGTANFQFSSRDTHFGFYHYLKLARNVKKRRLDGFFLRAESFYNMASEVDKLYEGEPFPRFYGGRSLHAQSHGESFMTLFLQRFYGMGCIFWMSRRRRYRLLDKWHCSPPYTTW